MNGNIVDHVMRLYLHRVVLAHAGSIASGKSQKSLA